MKRSLPRWLNVVAVFGIVFAILCWAFYHWDSTYYRVPKFIESRVYKSPPKSRNPLDWIASGVKNLRTKKWARSQIAEARSYMRDYPLPTLNCRYVLVDPDDENSASGRIEFRLDGTYFFDPSLPAKASTPLTTTGTWSMNSKGSVLKLVTSSGDVYRSETRGYFKPAGGHVNFDLPAGEGWTFVIRIGF